MGKKLPTVFGKIGEDGRLRHVDFPAECLKNPEFNTVSKMFAHAAETNPDRPCMGTRPLLSEETVTDKITGRSLQKCVYGDYQFWNFTECQEKIKNLAKALVDSGLGSGGSLAIFMDTCAHWQIAAQACAATNITVTTIYSTLGEEAVVYGLNQTEASHVVCSASAVPMLMKIAPQVKSLKKIIFCNGDRKKDFCENCISIEDLIASGKDSDATLSEANPDDPAVIMYTSGSTGLPKGVVITNRQLTSCAYGVTHHFGKFFTNKDRYIGYLPLAHILEMVAELTILFNGGCVGYGSPLTLSDASPKIKAGSHGDAPTLKPTLMACVPAILDRIRKNVETRIGHSSFIVKTLFNFAFSAKVNAFASGAETPVWDAIVFNKIKNMLGGELRVLLSGGAPLSTDTQKFINVCFGVPIAQGYGLTETCGAATICNPLDKSYGAVGTTIPSCHIKLVDWTEGGYSVKDAENPKFGVPRGEILIAGESLSSGYYKNEKKTNEDFKKDSEGTIWFHTGDIGQINPNGTLQIIDRKKDLVKLQMGEYVSLGKVEATVKQSLYCENAMIYASSMHSYCIVIVCPSAPALKSLCAEKSVDTADWAAVCSNEDIAKAVLKDIQDVCKKAKLARFEIPTKVHIATEEWTPESGLVTSALKLKRNVLNDQYKEAINNFYK